MADSSSVYEREREGAFGSSFSLLILELRDQGASTVRSYDTYVHLIVVGIRRKELCWLLSTSVLRKAWIVRTDVPRSQHRNASAEQRRGGKSQGAREPH